MKTPKSTWRKKIRMRHLISCSIMGALLTILSQLGSTLKMVSMKSCPKKFIRNWGSIPILHLASTTRSKLRSQSIIKTKLAIYIRTGTLIFWTLILALLWKISKEKPHKFFLLIALNTSLSKNLLVRNKICQPSPYKSMVVENLSICMSYSRLQYRLQVPKLEIL
jgi:hypothetical protein